MLTLNDQCWQINVSIRFLLVSVTSAWIFKWKSDSDSGDVAHSNWAALKQGKPSSRFVEKKFSLLLSVIPVIYFHSFGVFVCIINKNKLENCQERSLRISFDDYESNVNDLSHSARGQTIAFCLKEIENISRWKCIYIYMYIYIYIYFQRLIIYIYTSSGFYIYIYILPAAYIYIYILNFPLPSQSL